jgi:hypothetical protein
VKELEALARTMVGDDKSPNVYFVTDRTGKVIAIFTDWDDAEKYATSSFSGNALFMVEDRMTGIVLDPEWPEHRVGPRKK